MKKFKLTQAQKRKLSAYITLYRIYEKKFYKEIADLEESMETATGIEGIEFFFCDNACVGIGNADRTLELTRLEDLEASGE